MSLGRELNAAAAIGARDVLRFFRDWKNNVGMSIFFPVVFLGLFSSTIGQNLGGGLGYDFMQFALLAMVVSLVLMFTAMSVTTLVEEKETGFTQEVFVAPVSRYSIMIGKMVGGSISSLLVLACTIIVAVVIGIQISLEGVGLIMLVIPAVFLWAGAIGILISGICNSSPKAVNQATVMIMFPQMFFSGAIIPIGNSTGLLGVLAHLMPATYAVDLLRGVFYWGTPTYNQVVLYSPLVDLAVIVGMSIAFLLVGTYYFARSERNR